MSASKSKTKETSNQTQTSSGTATTTPNTPDWLAQPWQQYGADVGALQQSGQPLIAGAQPLQTQAWDAASRLGGSGPVSFGGGMAAGSPAKFDPTNPQINGGGGDGYTAPGAQPANNFDLASMLGMNAATSGANTATAQGYAPSSYTAAGYDPRGYQASQASASGFTQAGLQERLSPYLQEVVDTSLADYDVSAGRSRSLISAQSAANGGLRNSNNAIRLGLAEDGLARGRATTSASLRDQGFRTAADILGRDNDRSLQASLANAAAENAARQFSAGAWNQAGMFGADAQNTAGQFGANASNQAGQFNAGAANTNSMFNAGQQDTDLARQLQAAGLLGNLGTAQGADTRANIGLQADLGGQQRDIANSQSPAATQALIAQLLGGIPMDAFVGQTESRNQTGTGTGTSTGSQSGFKFDLADFWSPKGGVK